MKLEIKAYAKVNLFLDITGKLDNGYHTLNTVMQQIDLYDNITVETYDGDGIFIECNNPSVPCNEKNIAFKAALAFVNSANIKVKIVIKIEKHIPLEAGMGGSSTDGAAVLTALNKLYNNIFSTGELCEIGAKLGADVPFCITGGTAICKGIGDEITPTNCLKNYTFLVVKPDFSCSTAEAYKAYDDNPLSLNADFDEFVAMLPFGTEKWAGKMYNVFERLYDNPEIAKINNKMKKCGAVGSILTGSGSAVFGIFTDKEKALKAYKNIDLPFKNIVNPI